MKTILTFFLLFLITQVNGQDTIPLKQCPKSPNCVCTFKKKARQSKPTLSFKGDLNESREYLTKLVSGMEGAFLVIEENTYLHFEFHTSIGKFIDDVEFYFDTTQKVIHYRSASRKGYGDFGANKRRMKQIVKAWDAFMH